MMMKKYVKLHKCKLQQDQESSQRPMLMEDHHHHHHQKRSHRETNIDVVVVGDDKEVVGPHTPRSTKLMDAMLNLIVQRQPSNLAPKSQEQQ
ncbi:hypothetical protein D8674_030417 [Pyrus ussuriensis x Pyrus communis]|uniref:Uncharacterized protein n=1 Tax=Pyrus ussuriensis x Pyrus communis TaxID=2448454 RepID=A0A5N5EW29_9ROSA|nr:hypothetical protein D8674_030417 [Pyrus ussuriensis x Pyrus communis]